jgi:hypothetical protein
MHADLHLLLTTLFITADLCPNLSRSDRFSGRATTAATREKERSNAR